MNEEKEAKDVCSHCGKKGGIYYGLRKDLCYRCYDELVIGDDRGPDPYQERAIKRMREREEDL